MVWSDANTYFNDAFFLMIDDKKRVLNFPLWKTFTFRVHPVDQLLEAQDKINEALRLKPDYYKALFLKGVLQRQLNYNEESILYFRQAKDNDFYLYACNVYLAEYYIHKLKFPEALSYLNEVYEVYQFNARINLLLAIVHMELFEFEKAKKYINQLYQITDHKNLVILLNKNLILTEEIVLKKTNNLILKNFKLKSINYNLQLKTNMNNYFKNYIQLGINYDTISCFIYGLILKHITAYPNFEAINKYTVHTILNYLDVTEIGLDLKLDTIDFNKDFLNSADEYLELEQMMREEF